jgi:hypothetical protein
MLMILMQLCAVAAVQVSNVAASCRGALAASSARLDASRCALQGELQATLAQFDAVMDGTGELQVEVVDEVRRVFVMLHVTLVEGERRAFCMLFCMLHVILVDGDGCCVILHVILHVSCDFG